jgi:hypothetical protein
MPLGSFSAGLLSLCGRKAPDASFYDLATIDARERELQERVKEEKKEKKER